MDYYHIRTPEIREFLKGSLFDWGEIWESPCSDRYLYAIGMPDWDGMGREKAKKLQDMDVNFNGPAKKLKYRLNPTPI